jgi:predicted aminopeptidase
MKDRPGRLYLTYIGVAMALLTGLIFTAACSSVSYYKQAVSGHLSLMHQRQDIDVFLDQPQTDAALADSLRLSQEIIDFAEAQLQLETGGSYRQVVITGQSAVSWNVLAAEEFSITAKTWCFPVAGCVPYRGYFDQKEAETFAGQLRTEGFDVFVSPVSAYSTLGWFDDPLLDTMLRYSASQLAAVLIHELAHQKLYVAGDTTFNESFAEFVESVGVQRWLEQTGRHPELLAWSKQRAAEPDFAVLLQEGREALGNLYASDADVTSLRQQKQLILQQLQQDYARLVSEQWQGQDYFGGWLASGPDGNLNNAQLALAGSYAGGTCSFAALYHQAGEDLADFYVLAERQAKLSLQARQAWLQAPCNGFASAGKL